MDPNKSMRKQLIFNKSALSMCSKLLHLR